MNNPQKFRKKPVVIEAMGPLTFDNIGSAARWIRSNGGDVVLLLPDPGSPDCPEFGGHAVRHYCPSCTYNDVTPHLGIDTLEGRMRADLGDYVIKGVRGEFYPCKPGIFGATYEELFIDDIEVKS